MKHVFRYLKPFPGESTDLVDYMGRAHDLARVGQTLFAQRFVIFATAAAITAYFYGPFLAAFFYALIWLSEGFDNWVYRRVLKWQAPELEEARHVAVLLYSSTFISAAVICAFNIAIAMAEGQTMHFMPLFMLFSAGIFAAMNNHQILPVLVLRLSLYGAAIFFIPLRDIYVAWGNVSDELALQFVMTIFVLAFIIECSRNFFAGYQARLMQIRRLQVENRRAHAAIEAKTEFLSVVSHELRTPLTSIKGSLDLINGGALGEIPGPLSEMLTVGQRNCMRLINLINDLLDLQKLERDGLEFRFEMKSLRAIVQECIDELDGFASQFNVAIRLEAPTQDVSVRVDAERLKQVLLNLLSNAIKFSEEGNSVTLGYSHAGNETTLWVRDAGIGIAADHREIVFEAFSQIDSSNRRKQGGTGLGLNISKRIVEAHGGNIDFESQLGQGTTFYVSLPDAA